MLLLTEMKRNYGHPPCDDNFDVGRAGMARPGGRKGRGGGLEGGSSILISGES